MVNDETTFTLHSETQKFTKILIRLPATDKLKYKYLSKENKRKQTNKMIEHSNNYIAK